MDDVTKRAVKFARQEYANAKYDGENDIIVTDPEKTGARTFEFTIEGNSFPFIEYGSGTRAGNGYSTTKPYWFFSAKGRKIELKAGGQTAHYKRYTKFKKRWEYELLGESFPVKKRHSAEGLLDLGNRVLHDPDYGDLPIRVAERRIKLDNPEEVPKGKSYITKGNPPANVIPQIRQMIEDEMLKQFEAKYK